METLNVGCWFCAEGLVESVIHKTGRVPLSSEWLLQSNKHLHRSLGEEELLRKKYSEKIRRKFEREVSFLREGLKTWTKVREAGVIKILFRYLSLKAARVSLEQLNLGGETIRRQNGQLLGFFYRLFVKFFPLNMI